MILGRYLRTKKWRPQGERLEDQRQQLHCSLERLQEDQDVPSAAAGSHNEDDADETCEVTSHRGMQKCAQDSLCQT